MGKLNITSTRHLNHIMLDFMKLKNEMIFISRPRSLLEEGSESYCEDQSTRLVYIEDSIDPIVYTLWGQHIRQLTLALG